MVERMVGKTVGNMEGKMVGRTVGNKEGRMVERTVGRMVERMVESKEENKEGSKDCNMCNQLQ